MKILITGATGLLGPYLLTEFSKHGDVAGVARSSSDYQCDISDPRAVEDLMRKTSPHAIIHAAAMTNVDLCSEKPGDAVRQNSTATENLVRFMPGDCRFVYISTDMVYSGNGPHRENSRSENPINMYGISKFMGEFAAARALNHLIVRTNFYGKARSKKKSSSLLDFLLERFRSGESFPVFADAMFSPLYAGTMAKHLVTMTRSKRTGVFNLSASNGMSKSKFAFLIADEFKLSASGARPAESKMIKGRAQRPLDTRMEIIRTEASFGLSLPSMETDIKEMGRILRCAN